MKNLLCVSTIFVIHAFLHLTNAGSYYQSYERNTGHGYPDESGSYVTNFGNGQNKHNAVNMNESPDGLSISGTSYSKDRGGNPSVQKINVDFNEPKYNGGSQGPNVRYNPRSRTQITNIGNGQGNKNLFVFNDNRHDQDGNTGYRRESSHGYQGNTRSITNIGKGPDNDNRFYVDGKRVYPNAANAAGVAGMKAIEPFNSVISEVSRYANDFGNGSQNTNRIIINGKEVNPIAFNNNINISIKRKGYKTGETQTNNNNNTEDELLKVVPLYHSKQNKG